MVTAQLTPVGVGIHNVLIATDFSRYSNVALTFGLDLAHDYRATAYVVSVIPTDEILLAGPDAYVPAKDATRRDLLELKAELTRSHAYVEGKDYHLYMLEGAVAEAILDFACAQQIDLIVVATHGRSGLGKVLMGSVAEKVFRQSPVPVLTIGPRVHRTTYKSPTQNILVPTDFTPASERAVSYAAALARARKATHTILHLQNPAAGKGQRRAGYQDQVGGVAGTRGGRRPMRRARRSRTRGDHHSGDGGQDRGRSAGDGRAPLERHSGPADVAARL
jgi:nucleotide-binding universal stress UspA family protein